MFRLEKINDIEVKPVKSEQIDPKKILGYQLFPKLYSNILLCARRESGKTTTLKTIIEKCLNTNTKVIIFCSNFRTDKTWIAIRNWLKDKDIEYENHMSIHQMDLNSKKKIDLLENLINEINEKYAQSDEEDEESEHEKQIEDMTQEEIYNLMEFNENDDEIQIKIKKRKSSKLSPQYCLIFDDISTEMKSNPFIEYIIQTFRHKLFKIIICTQYQNHLSPQIRKNLDYLLLFKDHDKKKLKEFYEDIELNIDFDLFYDFYKEATQDGKKGSFLYIDVVKSEFRKNFNQKFIF